MSQKRFEFEEDLALLAGRRGSWPAGGASMEFLVEAARRVPDAVRSAVFLRVNKDAVSMNVGNYWLVHAGCRFLRMITTVMPPPESGWLPQTTFQTIDVHLVVTATRPGHPPAVWDGYAEACVRSLGGPQGRLNTHPRKPAYPLGVLEGV